MAKGEKEFGVHLVSTLDKFEGTAGGAGNGHGKGAVVVVCEHLKAQADLTEVVETLNPASSGGTFAERGQEEGRENPDDRGDAKQFQQRESLLVSRSGGSTIKRVLHGGELASAMPSKIRRRFRGEAVAECVVFTHFALGSREFLFWECGKRSELIS